jgi:hypothetical protein
MSARSGSRTGSAVSDSATASPRESYTMGNGSPQYRCLENSQSRNRWDRAPWPAPRASSQPTVAAIASGLLSPVSCGPGPGR